MRYLTVNEVLDIHQRVLNRFGGAPGIRDFGLLQSAVAQPQLIFSGRELYPTVDSKAAAIGFALIQNHPFVDGNKRVGYVALEFFLFANGYDLETSATDAEQIVTAVASGHANREDLAAWIEGHLKQR